MIDYRNKEVARPAAFYALKNNDHLSLKEIIKQSPEILEDKINLEGNRIKGKKFEHHSWLDAAFYYNSWTCFKILIEAIKLSQDQKDYHLHDASLVNRPEIAKIFLEVGADPNNGYSIGKSDLVDFFKDDPFFKQEVTCLEVAIYHKNIEMVTLLLKQGANIARLSSEGRSAYSFAKDKQLIHILLLGWLNYAPYISKVSEGDLLMLFKGYSMKEQLTKEQQITFNNLISLNLPHWQCDKELATTKLGKSVYLNNIQIAEFLLKNCATLEKAYSTSNQPTLGDLSALSWAIWNKNPNMVTLLLSYGAKITQKDAPAEKQTPFSFATGNQLNNILVSGWLDYAHRITRVNRDAVKLLIDGCSMKEQLTTKQQRTLNNLISINLSHWECNKKIATTVLGDTVYNNNIILTKALLKKGATVVDQAYRNDSAQPTLGPLSALSWAIWNKNPNMIALLMLHGARLHQKINKEEKYTPKEFAKQHNLSGWIEESYLILNNINFVYRIYLEIMKSILSRGFFHTIPEEIIGKILNCLLPISCEFTRHATTLAITLEELETSNYIKSAEKAASDYIKSAKSFLAATDSFSFNWSLNRMKSDETSILRTSIKSIVESQDKKDDVKRQLIVIAIATFLETKLKEGEFKSETLKLLKSCNLLTETHNKMFSIYEETNNYIIACKPSVSFKDEEFEEFFEQEFTSQ